MSPINIILLRVVQLIVVLSPLLGANTLLVLESTSNLRDCPMILLIIIIRSVRYYVSERFDFVHDDAPAVINPSDKRSKIRNQYRSPNVTRPRCNKQALLLQHTQNIEGRQTWTPGASSHKRTERTLRIAYSTTWWQLLLRKERLDFPTRLT